MPDLSTWVADMAKKHGFDPSAGGGGSGGSGAAGGSATATAPAPSADAGSTNAGASQAPSPSGGSGGSGAKAHADAAEAAAAQLTPILGQVQALEAEVQALVQAAQTAKAEATAAKTAVDQAAQGLGAPPAVPAPQGADPKAQYDSSIQISGQMRQSQADADARAADAKNQQMAAETAVTNVGAKATAAQKKVAEAAAMLEAARAQAATATQAVQQAEAEAKKSKSEADQAADDDPEKAELQKTAQEDVQHVARAKAALAKLQATGKQCAAAAKSAQSQAQSVESAKQEAQQAADAVGQSVTGLDAKLTPYGQAVEQAEAQESQCKENAGDDAQGVLEQRYAELGGDPELKRALAAEDQEFQTRVETHRAKIKDWQKDRERELDEQKAKLEEVILKGDDMVPKQQEWLEVENLNYASASSEADALGEKLETEPGKEMYHELTQHFTLIGEGQTVVDANAERLELTKKMAETVYEQYDHVYAAYEAAEEFVNTMGTELDNELQMDAMTLEQKVDFLQTKPKPVRDRYQKQLDAKLQEIRKSSVAETMAEDPPFKADGEAFQIEPLEWSSIHDQIAQLKSKSLAELQGKDPKLVALEEEYEAAGGDEALFEKRIAEWKAAVEEHHAKQESYREGYQNESEPLKAQANQASAEIDKSETYMAGQEERRVYNEGLLKALEDKAQDRLTLAGLSPQEQAEAKRLRRDIDLSKREYEARKALLSSVRDRKETAEKLRDQHKERYEARVDDDAMPLPPKPDSSVLSGQPLKAKYTELTGKPAPA